MTVASAELTDVTIHAPRTRTRGVKAPSAESRPWINHFPTCGALSQHQILHVGVMEAAHPTKIVRTHQTTTYFLACFEGSGRVLIDGRWRRCGSGFACLLPAHVLNAFEAIPGATWKFCWVCYQQPATQRPIAGASSPVMTQFDPAPLHAAITGLIHECSVAAEPALVHHWTELVHNYVLRFAQPFEKDNRLWLLWKRVADNLREDWSLDRLTREAGYSKEHLRRLCQSQMGRGPMHQVIYLRMHRAAELLATSDQTIEAVADQVGYRNPFVFSNAFAKWIGWRPSEYRRKKTNVIRR